MTHSTEYLMTAPMLATLLNDIKELAIQERLTTDQHWKLAKLSLVAYHNTGSFEYPQAYFDLLSESNRHKKGKFVSWIKQFSDLDMTDKDLKFFRKALNTNEIACPLYMDNQELGTDILAKGLNTKPYWDLGTQESVEENKFDTLYKKLESIVKGLQRDEKSGAIPKTPEIELIKAMLEAVEDKVLPFTTEGMEKQAKAA
jgi:hypothetical protein